MKKIFNVLVKSTIIASLGLALSSVGFADGDNAKCDNLSGTWTGEGHIKWYAFDCNYLSVAKVTDGNPALAYVSIAKRSGNFFCPSTDQTTVEVYCHDGRIEMKDAKIDVTGSVTDDGNFVQLTGTYFSRVRYHPITLNVTRAG